MAQLCSACGDAPVACNDCQCCRECCLCGSEGITDELEGEDTDDNTREEQL
jgi:hypothetical protein